MTKKEILDLVLENTCDIYVKCGQQAVPLQKEMEELIKKRDIADTPRLKWVAREKFSLLELTVSVRPLFKSLKDEMLKELPESKLAIEKMSFELDKMNKALEDFMKLAKGY